MTFKIRFTHTISLTKTLDIEIPALQWLHLSKNFYKTIYIISGKKIEITLTKKEDNSLIFSWEDQTNSINDTIISNTRNTFTFFMDEIDVGIDSNLVMLQNYYSDVCYMKTSPFNALLVTILSQNKTGEMTRRAFLNLLHILKELSPKGILKINENTLEEAIRIAGPYKVRYLIESSKQILDYWDGDLNQVVKLPTNHAFSSLMKLPGVAHKTAACVLVYSVLKKDIIPIDTHLKRVVQRLGLINIENKTLTGSTYMQINAQLQNKIPDAGYAHLLFVMLGREYCFARNPMCEKCPLQKTCPKINVRAIR